MRVCACVRACVCVCVWGYIWIHVYVCLNNFFHLLIASVVGL